jgi:hypothetical protein
MCEKLVKDLITGSDARSSDHSSKITIVRELVGEGEHANLDLELDALELLASTP